MFYSMVIFCGKHSNVSVIPPTKIHIIKGCPPVLVPAKNWNKVTRNINMAKTNNKN